MSSTRSDWWPPWIDVHHDPRALKYYVCVRCKDLEEFFTVPDSTPRHEVMDRAAAEFYKLTKAHEAIKRLKS